MNIPLFQDKFPEQPGLYIFRGAFNKKVDLIHVEEYPERWEFGIKWDAYLAVANYRYKNVKNLLGFFSEKLEFD